MAERKDYSLFVEHSCPICIEAEAILESREFPYKKYYTTASPDPGQIYVWLTDQPTSTARETIPAVPALFDKANNTLYCGLEGICMHISEISND